MNVADVAVLAVGCWGIAFGLWRAFRYRSPWGPRYGWHRLSDEEIERLNGRRAWRIGR